MDINAVLDECKEKLKITSDYKLAKELELTDARIHEWRKGKAIPDVYACFRIAEILGKSPSVILAQIQAVSNKNEAKRLYFKRFFTIAGLWITLGLISPSFSGLIGHAYAAGIDHKSLIHLTELDIMRNLLRRLRRFLRGTFCSFLSDTLRVTGT